MSTPQLLFANNAVATLATNLSAVGANLVLQTGQGALFPVPSTGQAFIAWLQQGSNTEAVLVSANGGDTFTIQTRGYEGTTAQAFTAGAVVEMRVSAGLLNGIISYLGTVLAPSAGNSAEAFAVATAASAIEATPLAQVEALVAATKTTAPAAVVPITVAGTPFVYTAAEAGALSFASGSITLTQLTRGTTTVGLELSGTGAGIFIPKATGDQIKISFSSGSPTATFFPS